MTEDEFNRAVLELFAGGYCDDLWWRVEDGKIAFHTNCSDFFEWGTDDAEAITPEDLDDLRKAKQDAFEYAETHPLMDEAGLSKYNTAKYTAETYWTHLWIARKRKMRPQGAFYKYLKGLEELFNEVGPEREISVWNPYTQDHEYKYKKPRA